MLYRCPIGLSFIYNHHQINVLADHYSVAVTSNICLVYLYSMGFLSLYPSELRSTVLPQSVVQQVIPTIGVTARAIKRPEVVPASADIPLHTGNWIAPR